MAQPHTHAAPQVAALAIAAHPLHPAALHPTAAQPKLSPQQLALQAHHAARGSNAPASASRPPATPAQTAILQRKTAHGGAANPPQPVAIQCMQVVKEKLKEAKKATATPLRNKMQFAVTGKERKYPSAEEERIPIAYADGEAVHLGSDRGTARKWGGKIAKQVGANFVTGVFAWRKSKNLGAYEKAVKILPLSPEEQAEAHAMVAALRKTLNRQALVEVTIGTVKQVASKSLDAAIVAPGVGEVIADGAASGLNFVGNKAFPRKKAYGAGGAIWTTQQWREMIIKFGHHSDDMVRTWMEGVAESLSTDSAKGEEYAYMVKNDPEKLAAMINATQKGADKSNTQRAHLRKAGDYVYE